MARSWDPSPFAYCPSSSTRAVRCAPDVWELSRCLAPLLFAGLVAGGAIAGPNEGGVLILHAAPSLVTTVACGSLPLANCADARTSFTQAQVQIRAAVFAVFPSNGAQRLQAVTFGLHYDSERISIGTIQRCGDFELADSDWPNPGTGTAVAWDAARTDSIIEVYGFLAYFDGVAPAELSLVAHPTQGAYFGDDSVPSQLDAIAGLGALGFGQSGELPCPNAWPEGACCFGDGHCEFRSEPQCAADGGTYAGDGSACSPNPCDQPGACCFGDGHCDYEMLDECQAEGGTYQGPLVSCVPNPCPDAAGACCFPDGTCATRTGAACDADGGIWYGYGALCFPNPCPQPVGACCFENGDCVNRTSEQCDVAGGEWQGGDVNCTPSPCPQPIGGCCFESGACTVLPRDVCEASAGVFYGAEYDCDPNPCLKPHAACCYPDGSCRFMNEAECLGDNGIWHGYPSECEPNPCPQPCGTFLDRDPEHTAHAPRASDPVDPFANARRSGSLGPNFGGTLLLHANPSFEYTDGGTNYCGLSALTDCGQAITRHDGLDAIVIHVLAAFHADAEPRLGAVTFGIQYGACTEIADYQNCADSELPSESWPGSGEGTAVRWDTARSEHLTEVYWFAAYNEIEYPAELALAQHPSQGAFFADDSVPPVLDPIAALGSFGFFTNGEAPCPAPPVPGACCFPDGLCDMLIEPVCRAGEGDWQGPDVPCTFGLCPALTGACCYPDGSCAEETTDSCEGGGGIWQGVAVPCDPNPCSQPSAACCFPDRTCQPLTLADCDQAGGTWMGYPSNCDPNPCPQPTGACCFVDGVCLMLTNGECNETGGIYQGKEAPCDPNPCAQPCGDLLDRDPVRPLRAALPRPPFDPFRTPTPVRGGGPNRGGTLILHHNPATMYTYDVDTYCGQSGLANCASAFTRHDTILDPVVIHVLAAFHESTVPHLAGLTFGVQYGTCIEIEDYGACGDFEVSDDNWPASGTGTVVTWALAQTAHMVEAYWFAAYSEIEFPEQLSLVPHPALGPFFMDGLGGLEVIAALGRFGFLTDGDAPCPLPPVEGACCALGQDCVVRTSAECYTAGGKYLGDNTTCAGNPCDDCSYPTPGPLDPSKVGPFNAEVERITNPDRVTERGGCGTLSMNANGTYEGGYGWQYGGVVAPTYGAFAECYAGTGAVCSVVLDLTQVGSYFGQCADIYVWSDAAGIPGNVLCLRTNVTPGAIAYWPTTSRHFFSLDGCCVDGGFWAGYWGNWPGGSAAWFIGADLDGLGGCPYTNNAPGIGFPTGWTNVSLVWGPTQALGIGVELTDCGSVPTRKSTWGGIKALFKN